MRLYIDVKPSKYTANSRAEIIRKLPVSGYTISRYGNYYAEDKDYVYAVNFQKFNKKTKQTKSKTSGKTTSTIIRRKHYVAYVYRLPKVWLAETKKEVKQDRTHFRLVSKK